MNFIPFFIKSRSYEEESSEFWESVSEQDKTLAIMPLKTMRYPRSPSVENAWRNVGRHLYSAMRSPVRERNEGRR